jgi:chemotaxis protein CheD
MSHYLLPLWNAEGLPSPKYGNVAIPKLIEKIQSYGAKKNNITAKIFGGGAVLQVADRRNRFLNVGARNIEIAFEILKKEGIWIQNYDVGGNTGRKIIMNTTDFKIRLKRIKKTNMQEA